MREGRGGKWERELHDVGMTARMDDEARIGRLIFDTPFLYGFWLWISDLGRELIFERAGARARNKVIVLRALVEQLAMQAYACYEQRSTCNKASFHVPSIPIPIHDAMQYANGNLLIH